MNNIYNPNILEFVKHKLKVPVALGGRRALALAGITFNRPFLEEDDHDFVIKRLPWRLKLFDNVFEKAKEDMYATDEERIDDMTHYYFYTDTKSKMTQVRNCLFINKNLVTTTYKKVLIVDPEQILYFKRQYIERSEKHKTDFENMNPLIYNLRNL